MVSVVRAMLRSSGRCTDFEGVVANRDAAAAPNVTSAPTVLPFSGDRSSTSPVPPRTATTSSVARKTLASPTASNTLAASANGIARRRGMGSEALRLRASGLGHGMEQGELGTTRLALQRVIQHAKPLGFGSLAADRRQERVRTGAVRSPLLASCVRGTELIVVEGMSHCVSAGDTPIRTSRRRKSVNPRYRRLRARASVQPSARAISV